MQFLSFFLSFIDFATVALVSGLAMFLPWNWFILWSVSFLFFCWLVYACTYDRQKFVKKHGLVIVLDRSQMRKIARNDYMVLKNYSFYFFLCLSYFNFFITKLLKMILYKRHQNISFAVFFFFFFWKIKFSNFINFQFLIRHFSK